MSFEFIPDVRKPEPTIEPCGFSINPFIKNLDFNTAESVLDSKVNNPFGLVPAPGIIDPLFHLLFKIYGDFYGTAKGDSCLFYPTCSHYSRLCLRDYGLIQGLWMTFGRLARAHTNTDGFYPVISHPEGIRYFDPPEHERIELYLSIDPEVRFDTELQIH